MQENHFMYVNQRWVSTFNFFLLAAILNAILRLNHETSLNFAPFDIIALLLEHYSLLL